MRSLFKKDPLIIEDRFLWASAIVVCTLIILLARLWYVQIYRGEYYSAISEKNRIRKVDIPAPRGILFDRNGQIVLGNRPFFDLVVIPQYSKSLYDTIKIVSRLLNIPMSDLESRVKMAEGRPKFAPIILRRNMKLHEVSIIETNSIFLPGVDVAVAPRRDYQPDTPAHLVGYLGEIDQPSMQKLNQENVQNPYVLGDLIGKQGIEARWENYLRGERGYRFIQVNALGRKEDVDDALLGEFPEVPAIPGSDLVLTIDRELQGVARDAFKGKYGAVIAMKPDTGEVLALVSEPDYDPVKYQEGFSNEEWRSLISDPFNPLLDKTTGGEFAPGSIYKVVVAIAALEEGVTSPYRSVFCPGYYKVGSQTFHCHHRAGHGTVNIFDALKKSCDVYFYQMGIELGVDRIAQYAQKFWLGKRLGMELNMERPGLVPTSDWKQRIFRVPWQLGETPSVAIGQSYNLITPLQIANLYAAIANGGKVWKPHLVNKVFNHVGEVIFEQAPELLGEIVFNHKETLTLIRAALTKVVQDADGTGKEARVEGHTVAGKTGSVQVVNLAKNRNKSDDVSMKWKEHALFSAFSPAEHASIVVAVLSEHDKLGGGGGKAAAPVARKIIEAYWQIEARRKMVTTEGSPGGELSGDRLR